MSSILITGASKGIGRATAAELARRGHRVVATAWDPHSLDDLDVDQRLRLDVTDQVSVDGAIAQAGQIDVLISNAGAIFAAAVEASPIAEIERLYAQNTAGAIRVAQAILPQMRQRRKGRLLFVSSIAGRIAPPGQAAYAADQVGARSLRGSTGQRARRLRYRRRPRRTRAGQLRRPGPHSRVQPARRPVRRAVRARWPPQRSNDQPGAGRGDARGSRGAARRSAASTSWTRAAERRPRRSERRALRPAVRPWLASVDQPSRLEEGRTQLVDIAQARPIAHCEVRPPEDHSLGFSTANRGLA